MQPGEARTTKILEKLFQLAEMTEATRSHISDYGLQSALALTDSLFGFLGFIDEKEEIMHCHAWSSEVMKECEVESYYYHFPLKDAGIWAEPIRTHQPLILNTYKTADSRKKGLPIGHVEINSYLGIPIVEDNHVLAIIAVANRPNLPYNEHDIKSLRILLKALLRMIERAEALSELRENERKFRIFADFTGDWETWVSPTGDYQYISPACLKISGYTRDEIMNQRNFLTKVLLDEEIVKWNHFSQKFLMDSEPVDHLEDFIPEQHFRIRHKSGKVRWIGYIARKIYDQNHSYLGFRESIRDITPRKTMEQIPESNYDFLPLCSVCYKIRDKFGKWLSFEDYFYQKKKLAFSHGLCPECASDFFVE